MDLVDDLPKHIVVVAAVEIDTLAEAVTHFAVNKSWHEGVRQRLILSVHIQIIHRLLRSCANLVG